MATYTLYSKNSYDGRKLRLVCNSTINIANNTSTINWTLYSEGGKSNYYSTGPTTVIINGVQVYNKNRVSYSSQVFPASKGSTSGTLTVSHNSDGKKSITVSLATAIYTSTVTTNSGTWTLDNIPRYATISSAPNFTDIQNPTIKYTNQAGNNVTSLQACISLTGNNDDIAYRDISKTGTSYTFNLTDAERNVLRNATKTSTTRTVYFYIKTVISGNTFYSNKAVTLTIVNANPTFSVAYLDTNSTTTAITNNNQQIIQNKSTLRINITNATALKYASLVKINMNINGEPIEQNISSSSLTINIGVVNSSQNLTVPITLTDSRGNKTTQNLTIQMLSYSLPSAIITLNRESNFYTQSNLLVNAQYSSLDSKNQLTIQYQIKKVSDSTYGSLTTIQNNVQTQFNADNDYSWNVRVILTDLLDSYTYDLLLYKGIPLMLYDKFLSSIGINCIPKDEYSLEVNGINILDSIYYKSGDSYSVSGRIVDNGYISDSAKQINFTLTLPKSMKNVTPTITKLKVNGRHVGGGYVFSNSYVSAGYDVIADSNITVSVATKQDDFLTVMLQSTTAWSVTNNTPISISIESMTITFS